MRTDFQFLPLKKQEEITIIRDLIVNNFLVEMIILFGSYARSENQQQWVKHKYVKDGTLYEYNSDFDFLVIVKNKNLENDTAIWDQIEAKAYKAGVRTWSSFVVDNIHYVNEQLELGRYFYSDIKKEGILLYDSGNYQLSEAKDLPASKRKEMAKKDFDHWFSAGDYFLDDFKFNVEKGRAKMGAFFLHQAAERFFSALLLVFSGYRPKTHDLKLLLSKAQQLSPMVKLAFFPGFDLEKERRLFEMLRMAYVDARYEEKYQLTDEELKFLENAVLSLREKVFQCCLDKF